MSTCIYDITASWADNVARGPQFDSPVPQRPQTHSDQWIDFLGYKVASRIGVPAGPLLDSRWTSLAASLGYDIVTYKTIRTAASAGHAPPNVLYLQADGKQLPAAGDTTPLQAAGVEQPDEAAATAVAITNSFGMPSMDAAFLMADIPAAQAALRPGQLLVVSVTGTPNRPDGVGFAEDFVQAALLAKQAGAKVIEANLSCPNVGKGQGALYADAQQVAALTAALVQALGPAVPLLLKVGAFPDEAALEAVLGAAAAAGARGVAGINGLSRSIITADGEPALGPDRPTSGVCGAPIRHAALQFVRAARRIIDRRQLGLALVGVGGVMCAQHAVDMLEAGADVVQSATGMMWHPLLAHEYHQLVQQQSR